jgi:hypothetical protein
MSRALGEEVEILGTTVRVSSSVGVAIRADGHDPDTILSQADAAMYRAKASPEHSVEIAGTADNPRPPSGIGGRRESDAAKTAQPGLQPSIPGLGASS